MYWQELYDLFNQLAKIYVPTNAFLPRDFMTIATFAVAEMQERTGYMNHTENIVVPANTNPVRSSYRIKALNEVRDNASATPYGIREYEEMNYLIDNWIQAPLPDNVNENRTDQLFPPIVNTDPATNICCLYDHQVYLYPVPGSEIVLTLKYKPIYPHFTRSDPYWDAWQGSTLADDSNLRTQLASQTPPREFAQWHNKIVSYVLWYYLRTSKTPMIVGKANDYKREFDEAVDAMISLKTQQTRFAQIPYTYNE